MDDYLLCAYFARDADRELQLFVDKIIVFLVAESIAREWGVRLIEREGIFFARLPERTDKLILAHKPEFALARAVHIEHGKVERVKARIPEYFHALVNAESGKNDIRLS